MWPHLTAHQNRLINEVTCVAIMGFCNSEVVCAHVCVCVCHTCCVRAPNVTGWKGNKLLLCWGKMICHMTVVETRLTDFLWLSELRWSRITPPSAALPTLCVNSLLNVYKVCVFVLNVSCCPELFHCTEFYLTWHLFTCPHSASARPCPALPSRISYTTCLYPP